MREILHKLLKHIFRSWEDEPNTIHPRLRLIPPFLLELLGYSILLSIAYHILHYFNII